VTRPEQFGIALCKECKQYPGELWPGQLHAYCDACRDIPPIRRRTPQTVLDALALAEAAGQPIPGRR
jgi:hypothetical protein